MNIETSSRLGRMRVVIDPNKHVVLTFIEIRGVRSSHIGMHFELLYWFASIGGVFKLEVLSRAKRIGGFTYSILVVNGIAKFSCNLWILLEENFIFSRIRPISFWWCRHQLGFLIWKIISPPPFDEGFA